MKCSKQKKNEKERNLEGPVSISRAPRDSGGSCGEKNSVEKRQHCGRCKEKRMRDIKKKITLAGDRTMRITVCERAEGRRKWREEGIG